MRPFNIIIVVLCGIGLEAQENNERGTATSPFEQWDEVTCCACVPFYQCNEDNVISESGAGSFDIRAGSADGSSEPITNVERCPREIETCCRLPTAPRECDLKAPALPSNTTCECFHRELCPPFLMVDSDRGSRFLYVPSFGRVLNSRCNHPLDVCCAAEVYTGMTTTVAPNTVDCVCTEEEICNDDGIVDRDQLQNMPQCPNPNHVCCYNTAEKHLTTQSPVSGSTSIGSINSFMAVPLLLIFIRLWCIY